MRAVVVALGFALAVGACASEPDPYAAYRQATAEDVPGSLDWRLEPPGDVRPQIPPEAAYRMLFNAGDRRHVQVTLARVANTTDGTLGPTAWVFVSPDSCFATEKGDLVSPGRTGNGCEHENLYVQGVDATTGETLGGFSAFDTVGDWSPARAGAPEPVEVRTQERITVLH